MGKVTTLDNVYMCARIMTLEGN